ncbi:MAG: NERD domain-containing protein [Clostridia bacterium]|nr:NERD domain-containing protein [Clostridia bacterium]
MGLIFAFFIICVAAAFLKSPACRGFIGEVWVKFVIGKTNDRADKKENIKYVINNLLLQTEDGRTSQTDHVVINKNGVFVIETKNYSGRIYGDDNRKEWTQVLNYGKMKNHFYSPVKQNMGHIYKIKQIIPEDVPICSIIVFVKGNIKFINSQYVYTLSGLHKKLKETSEREMTPLEMKKTYDILLNSNKSKEITNKEHVENIRKAQEEIEQNTCPLCKGKLIIRKGKYGVFLGCSNYPKCKFYKKKDS